MTPVARISAAIEILEDILAGESAEKTLTSWGRGNRYAGSKDRRAIRDFVFDAVRCMRSFAYLGGFDHTNEVARPTGRQLMIGQCRALGLDLEEIFCEARFAPSPMEEHEQEVRDLKDAPRAIRLDCPDWLLPKYDAALGDECDAVLEKTRTRSDVYLRVNTRKATLEEARAALLEDEIETETVDLCATALRATKGARAVARSTAYEDGLVELQDAGSQAIIDALPLTDGMTVLDYCAGGGGKSLTMAAKADISVTASDIDMDRMKDIGLRGGRAGVRIATCEQFKLEGEYDLVLCDVPCSGSGSWARAPQAKWLLREGRLDELMQTQSNILKGAAGFVAVGGHLAYATCSLFAVENEKRVAQFLSETSDFVLETERTVSPLMGGDGFYVAVFKRRA
jgi:16S rRNA (cytosine967-C5)-methyltransferase